MDEFQYVTELNLETGQIYEDKNGDTVTILEVGTFQGIPYFYCGTENCPKIGWFITDCPWLLSRKS